MKSNRRTTSNHRTSLHKVTLSIAFCGVSWMSLLMSSHAQETSGDLSVPVSDRSETSSNTNPQMMIAPEDAPDVQPTLPGGKIPQYQLTHRHLAVETDELIGDSRVRFLLALPAEPILVEATITIDGQPFRRQREKRVQAALKAALQPPESNAPPLEAKRPPQVTVIEDNEEATETGETSQDIQNVVSPAVASYQSAQSVTEKLRRYIASIGREPSSEEVRSFFIHRIDGPTLLWLNDNFQAFRADQTPIFHVLDRDRDGAISSEEIEQAMQSFLDCDLNRNEVVDYLEISEAANDPRLRTDATIGLSPLLYSLPSERSAAQTYADLLRAYVGTGGDGATLPSRFDANTNGRWEPEELSQLHTMPADLTLYVEFDSTDPERSKLTIPAQTISKLSNQQSTFSTLNDSIILSREDCDIWFSASQSRSSDQVSIGAVRDGYPMLPVIDPDDDGRFTLRELRGLSAALKPFDRDGDGQILRAELRPTIRIAFGRGPHVHQVLAGIRKVPRSDSSATTGPEWFVRMDRNKDRDLTRREFPGTDAQFAELDADGDELVSAAEALEFDRKSKSDEPKPETLDEQTKLKDE